ncbi:MAG: glycosyltransferase [Burkholderiales bacterium]|nr:glycosyltransferase [Phycisphaerae bacterium]
MQLSRERHPGRATVVITTKNRVEELRAAVASAVAQSEPVEVLVIDDGSTDGTADMIRAEFPSVRLVRYESSCGLIVRRNQGAALASTPIVVSIDDDAAFPSKNTVQQTLLEFDRPEVGAVAIPFINVNQNDTVHQRAPRDEHVYVARTFIGTAHAVRRDLFLALGGYREHLFHQGEESDYCIRMLDAGYIVRIGHADPIHHFESPRRDFRRIDLYGRRNDILFAWHNVPPPFFTLHLIATTLNGIRAGIRARRLARMSAGILKGYRDLYGQFSKRRPVRAQAYRVYRSLPQGPLIPLSEIRDTIPPMIALENIRPVEQ